MLQIQYVSGLDNASFVDEMTGTAGQAPGKLIADNGHGMLALFSA
jgi:hypothetical protein